MKRRSNIILFNIAETFITASLLAVILAILVPTLVYSADRLVVQDAVGETTSNTDALTGRLNTD